jgi:hypothetical protein
MTDSRKCANCKAELPSGYPAENRYCAKCTAAWQKGPTAVAEGPGRHGVGPSLDDPRVTHVG